MQEKHSAWQWRLIMRDYGKVYTAFWTSDDARSFTEDGRMLALYLMTCPHGNMLGCFRLPDAYAADDLKWSIERVSKGFEELFQKGYAYRCKQSFWVVIQRYLKWNQFENPNVGKAAGKLFDSISPPSIVRALLVKALRDFSPTFPCQKLTDFETLSIPFQNPFELISKTVVGAVAVAVTTATAETAADAKKPAKDATGSRLPADWMPSLEDTLFCESERPDLLIDGTASRFRDYWTAKAGKDARKSDWHATWRNWVRNEKPQARTSPAITKPEKFDPTAYVNRNKTRVPDERTIEFNQYGEPI